MAAFFGAWQGYARLDTESTPSVVEQKLVTRSKAYGGAGPRHFPCHHHTLIKVTHTHDSTNFRPVLIGDRGEVAGSGFQHPGPLLWPYEYVGGPVRPVLAVAIEVFEDGLIKPGTGDGHAMRVHGSPLDSGPYQNAWPPERLRSQVASRAPKSHRARASEMYWTDRGVGRIVPVALGDGQFGHGIASASRLPRTNPAHHHHTRVPGVLPLPRAVRRQGLEEP